MTTTLSWSVVFLIAISIFAYQIYGRFKLLLAVKKDDSRDYGPATWAKRFKNALVYAFGQYKFTKDVTVASLLHITVFWGFLTLGIQVVTMFGRGWFPDFHVPGFSLEWLGGYYAFGKDIFQVLVLVAVALLLYRWWVSKPKRLYGFLPAEKKLNSQSHWEAYLILSFIAGIMLSGFFYDAGRIVAFPEDAAIQAEALYQPISHWLAGFLSADSAETVAMASWWIHNLIILTFLNLLPRSKHFHIITSVPNVFFGKVEPYGKLSKSDFTSDNPSFGRSQPQHFTWKQTLDMFSCTECGRCSSFCPATATGKALAPRQLLLNIRDMVYANQNTILKKTGTDGFELDVVVGEGKAVHDDVIWSCNACRACEEACPVNIEYVDKIVDIRRHLVQEAARFPEELNRAFKGLETNSNPWGISSEERDAWAQGLNVPRIQENQSAEYLYYVGCGGAFDANNRKTTQAFVRILQEAKVSFAILGKEELCNGETARRLGNEYLFQTMAEALVAKLNSYGVKKIIVNCPHCFNTMTNEYPDFGAKWEVIRAGSLVERLIAEGKIKPTKTQDKKIVYHDSCYYGRFNDVIDEPRNLLSSIPGARIEEVELNKKKGTCCGAGGGRMWMEEPKDQRVNQLRAGQLLEKKPDVVAVSCPYCRIMVSNGVTDKGAENVEVKDVMQLIADSL